MTKIRFRSDFLPGAVLGFAAFWLLYGLPTIRYDNIQWMLSGDRATHFIGWHFFRNSPWTFPIGLNWAYGMGLGGSIVYSDSLPLFAFIFKPFTALLPPIFQYTGIWILLCLTLQGGFAWMLMAKITKDRAIQICGALFFITSTIMMGKLRGHFALGGHWTILAGLTIYFTKSKASRIWWIVLLLIASLTHGYLLIMNGALWTADCIKRYLTREEAPLKLLSWALFTIIIVVSCMWTTGYFTIEEGLASSGQYGTYRFNLLSFVNPGNRSYIFPQLPANAGDHDGFAFLGAGMMILVVGGVAALLRHGKRIDLNYRKILPLLIVCMLFTLYAITNRVGFANSELVLFELPQSVLHLLNVFKAAGRFIWPVYYVIMLSAFYLLVSNYQLRLVRQLFIVALLLQLADSRLVMEKKHTIGVYSQNEYVSPLRSDFWQKVASKYRSIRFVLPNNLAPDWEHFAYFASTHGMAINVGNFARADNKCLERERSGIRNTIAGGTFDNDTLYVYNDLALWNESQAKHGKYDYVDIIDGFRVVAPGWNHGKQNL